MPVEFVRILPAILLLIASAGAAAHEEAVGPFGFDPQAAGYNEQFVSVRAPVVALTDVRIIDGTGAPAREHQTLVIADGKILAQGGMGAVRIPKEAKRIALPGKTVLPGWVMLHEHLYYHSPTQVAGMPYLATPSMVTYPRLYLAGGVTTARTIGTYHPHDDLKLKASVRGTIGMIN